MCLAIPGRIQKLEGDDLFRTAKIDFGGAVREVNLTYVPEAKVGDWVLVHAGFALNRIDEDEAARTLEELKRLEESGGGLLDGDEFTRREQQE